MVALEQANRATVLTLFKREDIGKKKNNEENNVIHYEDESETVSALFKGGDIGKEKDNEENNILHYVCKSEDNKIIEWATDF